MYLEAVYGVFWKTMEKMRFFWLRPTSEFYGKKTLGRVLIVISQNGSRQLA